MACLLSTTPETAPPEAVAPDVAPTEEPAAAETATDPTAAPETSSETSPVEKAPAESTVRARRAPRTSADFRIDVPQVPLAGGASAADLLRLAPGVFLSQHSGQGKAHQLFLRGFDAEHGQDVEIHVGGIPINEVSNIHGQGYADLNFLFPEVVQSFRVEEGPYSPQQGDFAVAGSVDVDLGVRDRGVLARASYGNFGLARGVVLWAPEGQPDETFAGVEVVRGDGFGPARAFLRASAITQAVFDLDAFKLRVLASSSSSRFASAGVVVLDDLESGAIDRYGSYDEDQGGAASRHQALLEASFDDDGGGSSSVALFGGLRDLRLRSDFTGYLLDADLGDRIEQTNNFAFVGGRVVHKQSFDTGVFAAPLKVELGSEARFDDVDQRQQRLDAVEGAPYKNEIDAAIDEGHLGAWVDVTLRPITSLVLRGGLRFEALNVGVDDRLPLSSASDDDVLPRHKDAFGVHLGPKLSADWTTTPWLHLLAAYGEGFRSPQARSLGDGEVSPFTDVHAGEVGARAAWTGDDGSLVLGATASVFTTYVALDRIFDHASGANIFTGPSLRGGAALLLESEPRPWLNVRASGTFVASRVLEENTPVPYAPPIVMRSDVELHNALFNFDAFSINGPVGGRVALGVSAIGPRPLPFDEESAPVAFAELSTGLSWGAVELSAEVQNLTNANFFDGEFVYASRFDPDDDGRLVPQHHVTVAAPFSGQLTLSVRL